MLSEERRLTIEEIGYIAKSPLSGDFPLVGCWMGGCIYVIVNLVNQKIYVGQTEEARKRAIQHKNMLKNGTHANRHLQNAYHKYGENSFEFRVVQIVEDDTYLNISENYFHCTLQSLDPMYGYNKITVDPNTGRKIVSDETREKLSSLLKGRKRMEESNKKQSLSMLGRKRSVESVEKQRRTMTGKKQKPETIEKRRQSQSKQLWEITHPDGRIEQRLNMEQFCSEHGLGSNYMYKVANGKKQIYKGYTCRKIE